MSIRRKKVSSGITGLDQLLHGLFIGDNVVLYDDAGSLASSFCLKFMKESQKQKKPIVYVSFDRSPKNLIEKLGILAENQQLTILDCFTNGKGDKANVFNKFYETNGEQWECQIVRVKEPWSPEAVSKAIYGLHKTFKEDVRFVIESLTGMQDLWDGEEHILKFYSRSCPKLYELDTIAYWIIEKEAHSKRLKAHINQIAQVAIDLSIGSGKSRIKVLKAEKRNPKIIGQSIKYSFSGEDFFIEAEGQTKLWHDLGTRIKKVREKLGMSQKELSQMIGVTPSNISQIESNLIFPSLPVLYKIANSLSIEMASLFGQDQSYHRNIFSKDKAVKINLSDMPKGVGSAFQLTPPDLEGKAESYLIEILGQKKLSSHFFNHKGEEFGYVISGSIKVVLQNETKILEPGDTIYLKTTIPQQWINQDNKSVKLLWVKIK